MHREYRAARIGYTMTAYAIQCSSPLVTPNFNAARLALITLRRMAVTTSSSPGQADIAGFRVQERFGDYDAAELYYRRRIPPYAAAGQHTIIVAVSSYTATAFQRHGILLR